MHSLRAPLALALAALVTSSAATGMAAPRSVAIVNAAGDQDAGAALAARLRLALAAESSVRPLRVGEVSRALEEALPPTTSREERMRMAGESLDRARAALSRLRYEDVLDELGRAEEQLLAIEPAREVYQLMAEVAFLRADVHLRESRADIARLELRAVHRLDPRRPTLDPARYLPELVKLFEEARVPASPTATLRVISPFDGAIVYIDGHRSGITPALTQVPPGVHYVTGTLPGDQVIGERVVLPPNETVIVKLRFTQVTVDDKARDMRRRLRDQSPDATSRETVLADPAIVQAASRTVELTDVDTVLVILGKEKDGLGVAVYDAHDRRIERFRPGEGVPASELLIDLALVPRPLLKAPRLGPIDEGPPTPAPEPSRWWTSNRIKVGLAAGFIASIVGLALYQIDIVPGPGTVTGRCCTIVNGSGP